MQYNIRNPEHAGSIMPESFTYNSVFKMYNLCSFLSYDNVLLLGTIYINAIVADLYCDGSEFGSLAICIQNMIMKLFHFIRVK